MQAPTLDTLLLSDIHLGSDISRARDAVAFAIGEFADAGEKFPMIAIQAREIEVGEDVAQENQTAKAAGLEQRNGISSTADI